MARTPATPLPPRRPGHLHLARGSSHRDHRAGPGHVRRRRRRPRWGLQAPQNLRHSTRPEGPTCATCGHGRRCRRNTARWNLGAPTAEHWQRQASLRVIYDGRSGFVATLSSVDEFDHSDVHHERPCGAVPIAVHYQLALRFSQKGLRETFHAALREVRAAFDNAEPDIVDHFSRPAVSDQPER